MREIPTSSMTHPASHPIQRRVCASHRLLILCAVAASAVVAFLAPPPSHAAQATEVAQKPSPSAASGLRLLEDMQTVFMELAEQTTPSVVSVFPIQQHPGHPDPNRERTPSATGSGSGVLVDAQGHIVTNNHVVSDATEVEVRLSDRRRLIAHVVGRDQDTDLAVLKVASDQPLPFARFGDSGAVRVGQWVMAVGNPFGLERTVTLGVVSGTGRENINLSRYENFIQTDASINPGNSGGPLFNLHGDVIGINTAVINFAQGIGFAIPSNMVKQVFTQLLQKGRVVRAWLGVGIQPLTPELAKKFRVDESAGVLVNEVFEGDPASESGIHPGDVITKVDHKAVDSPNRLSRLVATLDPGSAAHVEVVRDGKLIEFMVALSERRDQAVVASLPLGPSENKLGLDLQDVTATLAEKFKLKEKRGALVAKVDPGTLAYAEGLRGGDLITEVNRVDINTVAEFSTAVAKTRRGDSLLLRVLREDRAFFVVLKTG
ncbi:MAG: Do family serine endopeptidase [Nitrospiraceae bacterium]